jgi:hypothetical protein
MLLNLFKKASEPKVKLPQGVLRAAYIRISGFTEGSIISLNSSDFRIVKKYIQNGEVDEIIPTNTNGTCNLRLEVQSNGLMRILVPTTTKPTESLFAIYEQTSPTSNNFMFKQQ